jgi:hypothetical protein
LVRLNCKSYVLVCGFSGSSFASYESGFNSNVLLFSGSAVARGLHNVNAGTKQTADKSF